MIAPILDHCFSILLFLEKYYINRYGFRLGLYMNRIVFGLGLYINRGCSRFGSHNPVINIWK